MLQWCCCEGKGTCIGCLMETKIRELYGEDGVNFLWENLKDRD